ncbi:MAG: hypothetical protein IJP44_03535 [Bacteroidales bacterium]|nr:hypothetical protein [Bacteroidales bacterium]
MKKHIIIILLILSALPACHKVEYNGQSGKILHKRYDPALNINYVMGDVEQTWDTLRFDLDQDGTTDLKICFQYETPYIIASKDWELSVANDLYINQVGWWSRDFQVFGGQMNAICVRRTVDNDYCYGWLDAYATQGSEGQVDVIRFYLRETCYCTCPNYPLKWGEK